MYRYIPLLFIAVFLPACAFLPPKLELPKAAASIEDLEPYLEKAVSESSPPSISVVVVKDQDIVYANAFGHADADRSIVATPDTVYQWWSITKLFTATAILQLQERGLLSIDDSVNKHLPLFSTRGTKASGQEITIKQLLSHSSGLGDIGIKILGWVHFEGDPHPNQSELLQSQLANFNKLKARPGEEGRYSNFGYLVLAALIESVTSKTYEEYILSNIVKPLGMQNTNFVYTPDMAALAAKGSHPSDFISKIVPIYLDTKRAIDKKQNGILWFNHVYSDQKGASGLIGPATDLIKFASVFLPGYDASTKTILSNDSIELMQTPIIKVSKSPAPSKDLDFGLAWFISDSNGERTLNHGGSGMAYTSMLTLNPDRNLATVVMTNSTYLGRTMGFKLSQQLNQINW